MNKDVGRVIIICFCVFFFFSYLALQDEVKARQQCHESFAQSSKTAQEIIQICGKD